MTSNPIKRDKRYAVKSEFCGHEKPRYVARFMNDYIGNSEDRETAWKLCAKAYVDRMGPFLDQEELEGWKAFI
jgi:hypothetical protein